MHERMAFAAVACAAYLIAARTVLNLYPVSMFDMYAFVPEAWVERVAVLKDGERTAIDDWGSWKCDMNAGAVNSILYKQQEAQAKMEVEGTGPEVHVTLVREVWEGRDGAWTLTDVPVSNCTVRAK